MIPPLLEVGVRHGTGRARRAGPASLGAGGLSDQRLPDNHDTPDRDSLDVDERGFRQRHGTDYLGLFLQADLPIRFIANASTPTTRSYARDDDRVHVG